MKTLVITNDYSPKKGGISTYIESFTKNLDFEFLNALANIMVLKKVLSSFDIQFLSIMFL